MNRRYRRLILGFLAILMLITAAPVHAEAISETRIIKVGVLDFKGFSEKQEDGSYIGYGIDYLNEIKKYNPSWDYEFVDGN